MNNNILNFIYLAIIVLLPIIPAFILFKYLPSTGNVEGPLKGLTIKFAGSFAGYFAVFILLYLKIPLLPSPREEYTVWTVNGKINTPKNFEGTLNQSLRAVVIPSDQKCSGNKFSVKLIVKEEDYHNFIERIRINDMSDKLSPSDLIDINDSANNINNEKREINIIKPFVLSEKKIPSPCDSIKNASSTLPKDSLKIEKVAS
jgi:hypothetical protein